MANRGDFQFYFAFFAVLAFIVAIFQTDRAFIALRAISGATEQVTGEIVSVEPRKYSDMATGPAVCDIEFVYELNNEKYYSNTFSLDGKEYYHECKDNYKVGDKIVVKYVVGNPENGFVEIGSFNSLYLFIGCSILVVFFSVGLVMLLVRGNRE